MSHCPVFFPGCDVRGIFNPLKTAEEVEKDPQQDHKAYVHNSCSVGNKKSSNKIYIYNKHKAFTQLLLKFLTYWLI